MTIRFVAESAESPNAIIENWDAFIRRIAFWPLPGDSPNLVWDPTDPQLRFTSHEMIEKIKIFVTMFTEHVVRPIILQKVAHMPVLMRVLEKMQYTLDTAGLHDDNNEQFDEMLESVQARIRGVLGLLSRDHGTLGSTKADAELLRQEADSGDCSLYNCLANDEDYAAIVAEYWRTLTLASVSSHK